MLLLPIPNKARWPALNPKQREVQGVQKVMHTFQNVIAK